MNLDPIAAAALAAHEGDTVREVIVDPLLPDSPGVPDLDGLPLLVPRALFAPVVTCDDCGTTARVEGGDALDLDHADGCHLGQVLEAERRADLAALAELRGLALPVRIVRDTSEGEAALQESRGLDATRERVVVEGTPDGGRTRWWPRLADEVSDLRQ